MSIQRKLNSLLTEGKVESLRRWLEDGVRPEERGLRRGGIYKDFELQDAEIVYKPEQLIVVDSLEAAREILKLEYENLEKSLGKGISAFYKVISDQYVGKGVSRDDVAAFLKNQPKYQLRLPHKKVVNRSLIAHYPKQKLEIDLVEMARWTTRGYKYVMTCVDVFTRFVWFRPLKRKEAASVRRVLEEITEEDDFMPKLICSDGGGEFKKDVSEWCRENGIRQSFTKSYSPLGLVETINQQLRRMLYDGMAREETSDWVKFVPIAEASWNTSRHAGQKHTPAFLFLSSGEDAADEKREALDKIAADSRKRIAQNQSRELRVGNIVRVAVKAISTKVRKSYKEDKTRKYVPIQWSPKLFQVATVIRADHNRPVGTSKLQYTLTDLDGRPLSTESLRTDARGRVRRAGRFFSSELALVATNKDSIPSGSKVSEDILRVVNRPESGVTPTPVRRPPAPRRAAPTRPRAAPERRREASPPPPATEPRRSGRERRLPGHLRDYQVE